MSPLDLLYLQNMCRIICIFIIAIFCLTISCTKNIEGCTDPSATNFNSESNLDDGVCEYIEIGANYQGGVIFYIDSTGQHGLIASKTHIPSSYGPNKFSWCDYYGEILGADSTSIGSGMQNTNDIIDGCLSYANYPWTNMKNAILSYNENITIGHSGVFDDWYIPSLDEFVLMYEILGNVDEMNFPIATSTGGYFGYWTSTEYNEERAIEIRTWPTFPNIDISYERKDAINLIRPIRSF